MSWTPEQYEAFKQKQIGKRLEAAKYKQIAKKVLSTGAKRKGLIESETTCRALAKSQIRKANPEYKIQAAFVEEMARLFPEVMVFSDCAAHIKKTMFQQMRANALSTPGEKWPDVFIAQPSGDFAGLYLECKAETPYKVDGVTLKKNEHNEAQAATMDKLRQRGYYCDFFWTVEQGVSITEKYLNL